MPPAPAPPAEPSAAPSAAPSAGGAGPWRALRLAGLLAAVAALGGALLAPRGAGLVPGAEALGTPAPRTVRADRDYELEDREGTARRRAAAAAAERPVYDHDDAADDEAVARIHAAFELMREEAATLPRGRRGQAEAEELWRRYGAQRDAFVARLQLLVRDEDLAALAGVRFSEAVERELGALAARGLDGLVVGDLALLPSDREAGLVVRTWREGLLAGEEVVRDPARVRDLAAARQEVARAAAARPPGLAAPVRAAILHLATAAVRPTLVYNQAETERRRAEAAARARPLSLVVRRGERIVGAGERIEERHLALFEAMRARALGEDRLRGGLAGGALLALLVAALWRAAGALPRPRLAVRDAALLAALLCGGLALAGAGQWLVERAAEWVPGMPPDALLALLPLAAGALVAAQVLGPAAALPLALATGLGAGLVAGPSLPLALQATVGALAAIRPGRRADRPGGPWRAGLSSGLASAAVALAAGLLAGRGAAELLEVAGAALVGGALLVPLLARLALLPLQGLLGYLTAGRLHELASLNHPALKELIVQAPGTYHHSILMGTVVEEAARRIGADPLLAKVGAYFHDLGKLRHPLLFAENQRGRSEHDELAPAASALAVRRHVADGLELARRWRLPAAVADVIAEHHGDRLVGYFWAKQLRLAEAAGAASPPDEAPFRYAGPRPRSREAALVMLADVCEASVRALGEPTGEALRAVVEARVAEIVAEGQLDGSGLTLGELRAVEEVLRRELGKVYQAAGAAEPSAEPRPEPRPAVKLVRR